jgi:D-sedoheptulose 7-phosphate isomerase
VIEALACARRLGLVTIALTGASGGRLRGLVDILIAVPSEETPRIQECHILAGHALCDAVEQALTAENSYSMGGAVAADQAASSSRDHLV